MTLTMEGLSLDQSLNLIMTQNQLWYKVMNERTILVIQDTPQKRQQYEDQVIRTFYISHADVTELTQLLSSLVRLPTLAVQPAIQFNKTANTITVRGTTSLVQIIEKIMSEGQSSKLDQIL